MIIGSCADVRWLPFDIVWNFGLRIVMQRTSVAQAHWHESEENRVYASVLERLTTISQAVHLWSLPFVKIENGHFAGMAEFVSLLRHAGGLHPSHLAWQGLPNFVPSLSSERLSPIWSLSLISQMIKVHTPVVTQIPVAAQDSISSSWGRSKNWRGFHNSFCSADSPVLACFVWYQRKGLSWCWWRNGRCGCHQQLQQDFTPLTINTPFPAPSSTSTGHLQVVLPNLTKDTRYAYELLTWITTLQGEAWKALIFDVRDLDSKTRTFVRLWHGVGKRHELLFDCSVCFLLPITIRHLSGG